MYAGEQDLRARYAGDLLEQLTNWRQGKRWRRR